MRRAPLSLLKAMGPEKFNNYMKEWHSQHPTLPKKPDRVDGNTAVRHFCDGRVDVEGTAEKVMHLASHRKGNPLNMVERALLCLFMPDKFGGIMDPNMAKTYCARRCTDADIEKIRMHIMRKRQLIGGRPSQHISEE